MTDGAPAPEPDALLDLVERAVAGEDVSAALGGLAPESAREVRAMIASRAAVGRAVDTPRAAAAVAPAPPLPARLGAYRLVSLAGQGGQGEVWRAVDERLGRDVALKLVPSAALDAAARARLVREIRAAARLAGVPGVVGVHDQGEEAGYAWFAMTWIEGETLQDRLEQGPLPPDEAARLMEAAARAVQGAHEAGVLHRDLKPGNLLLGRDGRVHVADFGLARALDPVPGGDDLTRTGHVVGTPAYLSPEQATGGAVDARTDVFGLGATLFAALTARPPIEDEGTRSAWTKAALGPPPDLSAALADVPAGLRTIVRGALAWAPDARYPSARAFAEDLARVQAGESPRGMARGMRGRLAGRLGLATAAVAGAGALVGLAWAIGPGRPDATPTAAALAGVQRTQARSAAALDALAAYHRLQRDTRAEIEALEDGLFGRRDADPDAPRLVAAVDAAAARSVEDHGHAPTALAWRGLARALTPAPGPSPRGPGTDLLEQAMAPAGEDPFPALICARACLVMYARTLLPALPSFRRGTLAVQALRPGQVALQCAEGAQAALAQAERAALWEFLDPRTPERAFARGARALLEGRYAEAADELAALQDDPGLDAPARMLRCVALYQARRFAEVAATSRPLVARRWFGATVLVVVALTGVAMGDGDTDPTAASAALDEAVAIAQGLVTEHPEAAPALAVSALALGASALRTTDPAEALARYRVALERLGAADAREPHQLYANLRGEFALGAARRAEAAAADPREFWTIAIAAFTSASGHEPRTAAGAFARGLAGVIRVQRLDRGLLAGEPVDPDEVPRAVADLDAALAGGVIRRQFLIARARASTIQAELDEAAGRDPGPALARGREDAARADALPAAAAVPEDR